MIHIIVEQFCSKKAPLVKKNNRIMFYSPSQVSVLIATLTLNISDRPPPHRPTKLNSREFACFASVKLVSRLNCVPHPAGQHAHRTLTSTNPSLVAPDWLLVTKRINAVARLLVQESSRRRCTISQA